MKTRSMLLPALLLAAGLLMPALRAPAGQGGNPAPAVPADVEVIRDVEYGTGGGRPLRMHLLRPKTPPEGRMPGVVWIHGGAWRAGSRDGGLRMLPRLVRRGYLGASIEYRLSGEARFPAQIEDCKAAVRFLRSRAQEYRLDPDRIGVWGSSAGGHLAALLGTSGGVPELEGKGGSPGVSSRVQAVCDFFGPTDFTRMGRVPNFDHDAPDAPAALLIGGPVQENKEKAARANPITYITKDDPPFLIMHGDQDPTVPLSQSDLLHEALRKAGVETTLHVVRGAGHGFSGPEIDEKVQAFFDRHLKRPR